MALEARIKQLLALEENRKCADCGTRSPRWASYSLGVFMCLQCAAFHRALGVHISRVKSCDLDRWTEDQVRAMEAVGNARGREEYGPSYAEANNTTNLPDAHMLESFIKSKYVRRLYAKGGFGASFNTPQAAAAAAAAPWKPQQSSEEDLIRIDWPLKPAAAAAAPAAAAFFAPMKAQKEPSLIDLFEPAPVQQQQQPAAAAPAAAPFDPFFSDFAAAPTAAAATAAPTNPFFGDFAAAPTPAAAAAATAPPAADLFGLTAAVAAPKPQLAQPSFASFPLLQQKQLQQLKPTSALSFDDDFGDFVAVAAAATAAAKMPSCALQQQQLSQQLTLLDNDSENVPPPLPAKDYDPFAVQQQPQQQKPVRDHAAAAAPAASDPLADLFASAATLAPSGAAATDAAPSASPRMATADIMALYGARSPGAGTQPPSMPSFVHNFGGNGASWA